MPRTVEWFGREVTTGIWKSSEAGRVQLRGVNLEGDDQADRRVHGGVDKAVYAYAIEDYGWWSSELGRDVDPGTFGEKLTTSGLDLMECLVGERWRIGSSLLEIAQPRLPCFKLGIRMGDAAFVDRFDDAARYGAYLRIVDEGSVEAGDVIEVTHRPTRGLRVRDIADVYRTKSEVLLRRVLVVPEVPESSKSWAERALGRAERGA